MISYIKDLFSEVRPEIKHLAERLKEGDIYYDVFTGLCRYEIESLVMKIESVKELTNSYP